MAKGGGVVVVVGGGRDGKGPSSTGRVGVDETRKFVHHQEDRDELYPMLWHACAGPLVYVPQAGEMVFYFLQGHLEQVEASTNQDGTMDMPIYNLPSKILCKVVNVQLKAESGTDEVFAQITLVPVEECDTQSLKANENAPSSLPRKTYTRSFFKKLTASDTSTHGGFSIPKRHADECLPPLDMSLDPPAQELLAKDLQGSEWLFRHIYRGQPKRHLVTTGWSAFVASKRLIAGDMFVFLRGETGQLRVGVRRGTKLQNNTSTTIISANSMQHGILASASHAISTGTRFIVYYRPWTSPGQFIVPFDRYMNSIESEYSVGTRFRMLFEGEECTEQRIDRFEGTVVGTEDLDHTRWPNSDWRCLKVKWDATSNAFVHPTRVSPWNIDLIEPVKRKPTSLMLQPKRPCPSDTSGPGSCVKKGLLCGQSDNKLPSRSEVNQGQENRGMDVYELGAKQPVIPHFTSAKSSHWNNTMRLRNGLHFSTQGSFHPCPSSTKSFPGGNTKKVGLPNSWCPTFSSNGIHENAVGSGSMSFQNISFSENWGDFEQKDKELPTLKLFGVSLVNRPQELPSQQVTPIEVEAESRCSLPQTSQSSVSEPSKSTSGVNSEKQCKNCYSSSTRSCTKVPFSNAFSSPTAMGLGFPKEVLKYGSVLGRSVDLARFDEYDALISELDKMFDFNGSLIDKSSGWQVAYADCDGDMMLIGDEPWQKFQFVVRKIFIHPDDELEWVHSSSPTPIPSP